MSRLENDVFRRAPMTKLAALFALLILAGCRFGSGPFDGPMTNEKIIAETKKCVAAGLKPVPYGTDNGVIYRIQCEPK